jgi:hypothetical protein
MKVRIGFVSNSSSSSFIISAPKDLKKVSVTFEVELFKKFYTLEEWTKYIVRKYQWLDHKKIDDICKNDEAAATEYEAGKKAIENGKSVVVMDLSSESDNPLDCLFYEDPSVLIEAVEEAGCDIIIGG